MSNFLHTEFGDEQKTQPQQNKHIKKCKKEDKK